MNRRILILGGTGFISSRLTRFLLDRGNSVTVFTRGKSKVPDRTQEGLTCLYGDRRDSNDLANAVHGRSFDAVYDMIAYRPEESKAATEIFRGKVRRFIHCSTVSVYMVSYDTCCPISEGQDRGELMEYWDQNPYGMEYGIRKRQCEEVLWSVHDEKLFPVTMLRPTYVSGPADPCMRDWFWIERILDGRPLLVPGSGDFAFQQVFVDDVAQAFADLLDYDSTVGKAYNVAAEEIYSLDDYLGRLASMLEKNPEIIHINQEEFRQLPFSSHPRGDVFTFNVQRTSVFSLDRIKVDIQYRSTPFERWMAKTIEWFQHGSCGHSLGYEFRGNELQAIAHWKQAREALRREFAHEM